MKLRLHQPNTVAATNVTSWSGTCYVTPLLGAFLADAYLGRYRTIAMFMIIYVIVSEILKPTCYFSFQTLISFLQQVFKW